MDIGPVSTPKEVIDLKILMINPPITLQEEKRSSIERLHNTSWPLGLAYLASMVRDLDVDIEILDAQLLNLTKSEIKRYLYKANADIIGITATTASIKIAAMIAQFAKEEDEKAITIIGGPHMTADPINTLKVFPQFDLGVVGDGEETFRDLIKSFLSGDDWKNVGGIAYQKNGNEIVQNSPLPLAPLDDIPFPAWDLLPPLSEYRFQPSVYRRKPHAFVVASRGCPYKCTFCHIARVRPKIRYRSPENILEEIEYLIAKYGIREIRFADELFTSNKKWVYSLCNGIIERNLDLLWTCDARADLMTPELAKILSKAGCWQISIGVESGSPSILKKIKKGITRDQVKNTVKYAHNANITVRAFFMLGFPFETKGDIEKTINFSKTSGVDFAQFSYVIPFPATEIYDICKERGDFKEPGWLEYNASEYQEPVIAPNNMTKDEVKKYFKRAYREFYFRPKFWYQLLRRIQGFEDVRRYLRGASSLIKIG